MSKLKEKYSCSLILTNDLLGGKWKLRILWHILSGDNRFSKLQKAISDISHKVLSSQLKELEESGLLIREIVEEIPPKIIIYHLNSEYKDLVPIIKSICKFTNEYAKNNGIKVNE